MRRSNVLLIFRREVRDQIRDRRTLFMIFVLPILLYPILGIGSVKLTEAFGQEQRKVVVVGYEFLPEKPPLLDPGRKGFDPSLFDNRGEAGRLTVEAVRAEGPWLDQERLREVILGKRTDAVVVIPGDLRHKLDRIAEERIPIFYESTNERSQTTYYRVKEVIDRWKHDIVNSRLHAKNLPATFIEPVQIKPQDVAAEESQGVNVWSRLFPFLLVMMSLTGAFYPSIDLCAGEKERGTMETLLISPASRGEIVMGKFLTVVLASMMTALLNIVSMGLTGIFLVKQIGARPHTPGHPVEQIIAAPSLASALWMVLLLVPLSAFFSAVCVALAVLAKSMKEGQYYLTPLYMVCVPLVFLTLMPGIELNLFYSLIPVTGVSLLLRSLILGDYDVARRFFLPVLVPTLVYAAVALRWAVDQFHREDVLFREAERFDLRLWVRHLLRDKEPTPTGGEALLCFALMLTSAWFLMQYLAGAGLATSTGAMAGGQIAFILTPPLAMAVLLTSSPRRTLRLYWPDARYLALGVGLALALNPLINELRPIVERLFPVSPVIKTALAELMSHVPGFGAALLLFALIPAVCEEVAFRGFILSGLERGHRERSAILLSALLFGFMHVLLSLFQQLFNATLLGLVLGLLAVRSRSLLPGILFHVLTNGLAVALGYWVTNPNYRQVAVALFRRPEEGLYHYWLVALSALVSTVLLTLLWRSRPAGKTVGESGGGRRAEGDRSYAVESPRPHAGARE